MRKLSLLLFVLGMVILSGCSKSSEDETLGQNTSVETDTLDGFVPLEGQLIDIPSPDYEDLCVVDSFLCTGNTAEYDYCVAQTMDEYETELSVSNEFYEFFAQDCVSFLNLEPQINGELMKYDVVFSSETLIDECSVLPIFAELILTSREAADNRQRDEFIEVEDYVEFVQSDLLSCMETAFTDFKQVIDEINSRYRDQLGQCNVDFCKAS